MKTLRALLALDEGDEIPVRRTRRDWVVDVALFVLAIGLGAVSLATSGMHGLDGPMLAVDGFVGIVMSVLLWWRRQWPVALALLSLLVAPVSSASGPVALIMLFTVAAHRRWQLAVLLGVLDLLLQPIARVVHPQGDSLLEFYISGVVFTGGVIAAGMVVRSRRQAGLDRVRRDEAEQLLHVEQARYGERTRIAREMHDVLAHRISLLSLHAGALEFRPDASPEEVARAAGVIRYSAHQALEDLRAVIGVLRDGSVPQSPAPPQPTLAALPAVLEESRAAGMQLSAAVDVDVAAVPDVIGRHALRIVQEALTNARKHATGAVVDLSVRGAPGDGLTIEVRNPVPVLTPGAARIPGSGTGLIGLGERVALSGGRLEHGLDEAGDFRLCAWLPW